MSPSSFKVFSFDCYGTLIDWETGIWDALAGLAAQARLSRSEFLTRYADVEPRIEHENPTLPYRELLALVYYSLADALGVTPDDRAATAFAQSVGSWPPFPDSPAALDALQREHRLVILSNVDRLSFAGSSEQLGLDFDAVYTAEDIGSYKPDPRNFEYLIERVRRDLGVEPGEVLHVAQSLYHDHVPALAAGLSTAWIDRQGLSQGGEWGATAKVENRPEPTFTFSTLQELADAALAR